MDRSSLTPAGTEPDYTTILRANLNQVFNERDATRRRAAVDALFSAQATLYEPDGIVSGGEAISHVAGALLEQFGPDFAFEAEGAALGHHGLGYLRWRAGPKGGPVVVSGVDVAQITDGKIAQLWVLLDPPHGAPAEGLR